MVRRWLRNDQWQRLVRVLPGWSPPDIEVPAMTSTRLLPAKVRLFVEFLVARMAGVEPGTQPK